MNFHGACSWLMTSDEQKVKKYNGIKEKERTKKKEREKFDLRLNMFE